MQLTTVFIAVFLLIAHTAFAQEFPETSVNGRSDDRIDIASIKTRHYRNLGFELLPEFISDSTIGPGQFAAIGNVVVGKGATLSILGGTTVMFEPQKRFIVEGTLFAASTDNGRVVLTNMPLNVRYVKIAVADSLWNGITAEPGGRLLLNRIAISNAATGITINGDTVRNDLSCVDMHENVAVHLVIAGKSVIASDPGCISSSGLASTISVPDTAPPVVRSREPNRRIALRATSCVFAAGGLGLAVFGGWQYRKNALLYEKATDPAHHTPEEIDRYREKALRGQWLGLAGGIACALGSAGVTLTFVF